MAVFMVGRVLEPEVRTFKSKGGSKEPDKVKITFGILSGRTSTIFTVWQDDRCYDAVESLQDGDFVVAVIGYGIKEDKLVTYLNRIAPASDDLPDILNSFFATAE